MNIYRIRKLIAFSRFIVFKLFFNKCSFKNFIYSNVRFKRIHRISIGNGNVFYEKSSIIVDYGLNEQSIEMGDNNIISSYSILKSHGGLIKMGNNNFIGERTQIQGRGNVIIGNGCLIAANTFVSSSNHNFQDPFAEDYLIKEIPNETKIDDFVWIGANCVITSGVDIGHHVIVAAGTIVTKDIKPYSMVAGNPGRIIKRFDKQVNKWIRI